MESPRTVLINDLTVYRQRSGVGCYVAQLLEHVDPSETGIQFTRLSETVAGAPLRAFSQAYVTSGKADATAARRSIARRIREGARRFLKKRSHALLNVYLTVAARFSAWPLYHEPDAVPLDIPAPTITTVHDLSVLLFPQWHPKHRVAKYETFFRKGMDRTRLVLAVSESTKRDLIEHLGVDADKIIVVPEAPRPEFRILEPNAIAEIRSRWNLPKQYLLYVGTIEPRKNVAGLLRAYSDLEPGLRSRYPLLLAGGWGWKSREVREMLEQPPLSESVQWLGFVPDQDLVAITNGATALLYPSFYEGFGLPPLEAMACGVPVITTHAGSLEEVVADAALIVDPFDEKDMAHAMTELLRSPELAQSLRERGFRRVEQFSWRQTARMTADAYRKVA